MAPVSASASEKAERCISAHADGQVLRTKGELIAARERFLSCVVEECPAVIRTECVDFAEKVEAAQPSVVLAAVDENGRDLTQVRVTIDDTRVVSALDGIALSVDPGTHRVSFELPDGRKSELSVVLHEAEKYRRIEARFAAPKKAAAATPPTTSATTSVVPSTAPATAPEARTVSKSGVHALTYVFGATTIVALGSFAYFALDGHAKEQELDKCRDDLSCRQEDADAMQRQYLFADISLIAAGASLGLGTYFFFKGAPAPSAANSSSFDLEIKPVATRRGAFVSAAAKF